MTEQQKSYRQIFKATSIFGGVQVFDILISIVKSKFVAILLGPAGMGIAGLLTATSGFVFSLTNFGLGTSAVKNVAAAAATGDDARVATVVTVLRRLVWVTGIFGMIVTAVLSPWLSELTFGNKDYTLAFIWISVTLLFRQLSTGQIVLLRGLRKIQYLAKANVAGASIGLIISIPVYYIWKLNGIVPVIIISSLTAMILSWHFARKIKIGSIKITAKKTIAEGRDMLRMGFILSLSGIITVGFSYIIKIYISNTGGIEQVGLYTAGFAVINTYVGMVFTAMSTDYYARLSSIAHNNIESRQLINQQAEIAILILSPILAVFLIFINWIVILIYSQKFIVINDMIHWAALGIYFKAASWSIAFILLAKGATKTFFWSEFVANVYVLMFNVIGYKLAGLEGIGISFLLGYFVYFLQVLLIARRKYEFSFEKEFYQVAGLQLLLGLLCFAVMRVLGAPWTYIAGTLLILISVSFSFREMNRRLDIKSLINNKLQNE